MKAIASKTPYVGRAGPRARVFETPVGTLQLQKEESAKSTESGESSENSRLGRLGRLHSVDFNQHSVTRAARRPVAGLPVGTGKTRWPSAPRRSGLAYRRRGKPGLY